MNIKSLSPFTFLTLAVFLVLLLPTLVQDGMFADGVTYAAIAKNLANGHGSFLQPHYTKILYPAFYEHPPLVSGIQSLFFHVLGDGIYTERIYCLLMALLTAWGIVLCWRLFTAGSAFARYAWVPVLLWIATPKIFWAYSNNVLENTLGVFTLFSVYFIAKAMVKDKMLWLIPGSLCIAAAFLSKGFVGLFPMAAAVLYAMKQQEKRWKQIITVSTLSILLPLAMYYGLTLMLPGLHDNIHYYLNQQLLPALNNQREITTENRFRILYHLLLELLAPLILLLVFWVVRRKTTEPFTTRGKALFFILIGLSASLPLMITLKQRSFYLVPCIPFFALGISMLMMPFIGPLLDALSARVLSRIRIASLVFLTGTLIYSGSCIGSYSRDEEKLKDIYRISEVVPEGTILGCTEAVWNDWGVTAYFCRIGYLSLDSQHEHEYFLLNGTDPMEAKLEQGYEKVDLGIAGYVLLKRR
jgi:hypothetical protein